MDKAWQLCVVDRDAVDLSKAPEFEKMLMSVQAKSPFPNGTPVFVVTSELKSFKNLAQVYQTLTSIRRYAVMNGILFSYVWMPTEMHYGWIMHDLLRPILTERDAVEMEAKFGLNLEEFT